ncbi:MAG TPA: copper resistance protein NlpE N-terminal domain-containing protein [Chitinophaga sp.]|uniref:copper resistance protein NlpE N-terminal domain-containing protein n=1 Tax=Chitinophaga sp. TaxID=1869181 RepID=UPI002C3149E3|nr:copper resistance protein NlpE N-terminal domain-containing protein [Chitinophaga sp.]HVI46373.1 copper resistance protein NlpE N-terminal domain-containing protein [Chitinophaga sp.]
MNRIFLAAVCVAVIAVSCNAGSQTATQGNDSAVAGQTTPPTPEATAAFATGTFKGTIPGGSTKRNVTIMFKDDSSFVLTEAYLGQNGKADPEFNADGSWSYDNTDKKIYLRYKNLADRGTYFSVVDEKTIQMHDGSMQTKTTAGNEYNLTRQ